MCGIAGVIHRDGPSDLGTEITRMLQSMKHRGPDSTGYALYGPPDDLIVVRFMLAEPKEYGGFGVEERIERNRAEVESRLANIGADVANIDSATGYAIRPPSATRVSSSRWPTTWRTSRVVRCSRWGTRSRSSRTLATPSPWRSNTV